MMTETIYTAINYRKGPPVPTSTQVDNRWVQTWFIVADLHHPDTGEFHRTAQVAATSDPARYIREHNQKTS